MQGAVGRVDVDDGLRRGLDTLRQKRFLPRREDGAAESALALLSGMSIKMGRMGKRFGGAEIRGSAL